MDEISSSASPTITINALNASGLPNDVKIKSIGESGMCHCILAVKLLGGDSERFAEGS